MNKTTQNKLFKFIFFIILPILISINVLGTMKEKNNEKIENSLSVTNGYISLYGTDCYKKKNIKLNGSWEFYPKKLLEPNDFKNRVYTKDYIYVPGNWNKHIVDGFAMGGIGYGTYKLNINLPISKEIYALKIPEIYTSFRLFINGELYSKSGVVSNKKIASSAGGNPKIVYFPNPSGTIEIIIQVSNYAHRDGGVKFPIYFGTSYNIDKYSIIMKAFDIIIATVLIVIGIIFMIEYVLGERKKQVLYFSIVCIMLFFRMLFKGQSILYNIFGDTLWTMTVKLEYMNLALIIAYISKFYIELCNEKTKAMIAVERIINIIATLLILLTLILPIIYVSYISIFYIVYSLIIVCVISLTLSANKVEKDNAPLIIVQPLIFLGVFLEIGAYVFNIPSMSYFTVFTLPLCGINSFLILKKISHEFKKNQVINKQLENMVLEKSNELNIANAKLIELNIELQAEATTDPLTGIYNRRNFEVVLTREAKNFDKGNRLSLAMLDIDFFKKINDNFGHEAGDDVLKEVVDVIKDIIRTSDVFARWGGEEFIILFPNTDLKNAVLISEKIRKSVYNYNFTYVENVTLSIGVAELDKYGKEKLIATVDERLYKAKKSGRNKVVSS